MDAFSTGSFNHNKQLGSVKKSDDDIFGSFSNVLLFLWVCLWKIEYKIQILLNNSLLQMQDRSINHFLTRDLVSFTDSFLFIKFNITQFSKKKKNLHLKS